MKKVIAAAAMLIAAGIAVPYQVQAGTLMESLLEDALYSIAPKSGHRFSDKVMEGKGIS
jgi:hypothetical protein